MLNLSSIFAASTAILPEDWNVFSILRFVVTFLTFGIGAAATVGFVISGYTYLTARDNPSQVAKAKTRMFQIVVGIVIWAVFYGVLNWLLPGGNPSDSTIPTVTEPTNYTPVDVGGGSNPGTTTDPTNPGTSTDPGTGTNPGTQTDPTTPTNTTCQLGASKGGSASYVQWSGSHASLRFRGGTCRYTIQQGGCAMLAAINAASKVTGCDYSPTLLANKTSEWTNNFKSTNGFFSVNSHYSGSSCTGTKWENSWTTVFKYLEKMGVQKKAISKNEAKAALERGHTVIARGVDPTGNGIFSKNGHWVAFTEISSDGTVTVPNAPTNPGIRKVSIANAIKYADSTVYEIYP